MDEEIRQIQLDILNELRAMREQGSILGSNKKSGTGDENVLKYLNKLGNTSNKVDKELEDLGYSSKGLNRAQIEQIKTSNQYEKAIKAQTDALKSSTENVKELGKELLSQKAGLEKYSKSIEGFTGTVGEFLTNFGILGKSLGSTITIVGKLGSVYLEQTDRILKANDQLAKFGTAGSFTSKELLQMAHGANLTSKNLELFTKPIQSMGSNMLVLGKNTGDSVKAFADLAKISYQQRESYQRLGVSQEELIQTQSDYITLQSLAGRNIKSELKDRVALQKATLAYQDSLLELATLTGQDVDAIKKRQQEAVRAVEWQISLIQLENKARRLESDGRKEESVKLRAEVKSRQEALARITALGNDTLTRGARSFLSTGTITGEEAQALTRMGLMEDLKELRSAIQSGSDVQKASNKFQDEYNKKFGQTIDNVGFASQISKDIARQFGISENSLEKFNQQRDINFKEASEIEKQRLEAAKKAGKDPAQDVRATLTTYEQKFGKFIDSLVAEANPLISGLNKTTVAATFAAAALGALALTAGSTVAGNLLNRGKGTFDSGGGSKPSGGPGPGSSRLSNTWNTAKNALEKISKPLIGFARAAPALGAALAVGSGISDTYENLKKTEKDLQREKINAAEARLEKAEAMGSGTGSILGGTAGAFALGSKGALMGMAFGPLGAAIGGIIGTGVGSWLGSKAGEIIGEVAGGSIAKFSESTTDQVKKQVSNNIEISATSSTPDGVFGNLPRVSRRLVESFTELTEIIDFTSDSIFKSNNNDLSKFTNRRPSQSIPKFNSIVPSLGTSSIDQLIKKIIQVESGGRNIGNLEGTSSAFGLAQITRGTFNDLASKAGPNNPLYGKNFEDMKIDTNLQIEATRQLTEKNKNILQNKQIPITDAAIYLAHFLGASGAVKVLTSPDSAPINTVVSPDQLQANALLRRMNTAGELKNWAEQKMNSAGSNFAKRSSPKTDFTANFTKNETAIPLSSGRFNPASFTNPEEFFTNQTAFNQYISKTSFSENTTKPNNPDSFDKLVAVQEKMISVLSGKIDSMIDQLNRSNVTQDRLLQVARV